MSNFQRKIAVLTGVVGACLCLTQGSAQTLATYSFTGAANGTTSGFAAESPASDLTFSALGNAGLTGIGVMSAFVAPLGDANGPGGVFPSVPPYVFDGKGFEVGYDVLPAGSNPGLSASPLTSAANYYLQFLVQANAGYSLSVNSVSIDFGTDFQTTFNPSVYYNLYYSIDGANFYRIGDPSSASSNSSYYKIRDDVTKPFVADPAAIPTGTEALTFRMVFGDGNSGSNLKRLFVDDIKLNGAVSLVPEPTTFSLALLGGLALFAARQRSSK